MTAKNLIWAVISPYGLNKASADVLTCDDPESAREVARDNGGRIVRLVEWISSEVSVIRAAIHWHEAMRSDDVDAEDEACQKLDSAVERLLKARKRKANAR